MNLTIFAQDIALTPDNQAIVAANGELVLTDGPETGEQDIRLRLFTYLGTLFYDTGYGSRVIDWVNEENTPATRLAFEEEVCRTLRADPRVQIGAEQCRIVRWDHTGIKAEAGWKFIETDHAFNLTFFVDAAKLEMVITDVRPDPSTL